MLMDPRGVGPSGTDCQDVDMVLSLKSGTQYSPLNTVVLIIGPPKMVPLILGNPRMHDKDAIVSALRGPDFDFQFLGTDGKGTLLGTPNREP